MLNCGTYMTIFCSLLALRTIWWRVQSWVHTLGTARVRSISSGTLWTIYGFATKTFLSATSAQLQWKKGYTESLKDVCVEFKLQWIFLIQEINTNYKHRNMSRKLRWYNNNTKYLEYSWAITPAKPYSTSSMTGKNLLYSCFIQPQQVQVCVLPTFSDS